jgi:putative PIN family toxin of toxin-antitoxin system
MKVILDTNILVSALMKPEGREALVLLLALRGQLEQYLSPAVLAEYHKVLPRPGLKLNSREVEATLENVGKVGHLVHPTVTVRISDHESDNRFYECAAAAHADCLVTGNGKHFPKDLPPTKIVNARQLLDLLSEQ